MDSTFQDSPTIGRSQILGYSSQDSPLPTPLSAVSSRYVRICRVLFSLLVNLPSRFVPVPVCCMCSVCLPLCLSIVVLAPSFERSKSGMRSEVVFSPLSSFISPPSLSFHSAIGSKKNRFRLLESNCLLPTSLAILQPAGLGHEIGNRIRPKKAAQHFANKVRHDTLQIDCTPRNLLGAGPVV